MYARLCAASGGVAVPVGPAGYAVDDLPWPMAMLWYVVAMTTLLTATLALLRTLPRGRGRG
ncbi:MAG: hypothetical protein J0I34_07945 [Pseudonocardia sp.]|uniref:hypothetical protein n=1 Tax=unclassified Pseudonocardia TaxID=2619320 RepID=UPI0008693EE2|nr:MULTISPECIES: hypothetical protein [unclassified Pseudonocardia]MBN9108701.1 hypothetical protein [Pseudonocardia sp.]ODU22957.1 MAG: hypothetical protein ABS80_16375 [Pseudonocardia sp. SCN 72-51]ODV07677.1 MAG: hypothetical protein ABT15_06195 [Pseudonocardia sp. SCN 73-27]